MADLENKANVLADTIEVLLGDDQAMILATVELFLGATRVDVKNIRLGSTPVAKLHTGHLAGGKLITNQSGAAELRKLLTLHASNPSEAAAVGQLAPTIQLQLHDPQAGDATSDIFIYAAVLEDVRLVSDGEGNRQYECPFSVVQDDEGKVWSVGEVTS